MSAAAKPGAGTSRNVRLEDRLLDVIERRARERLKIEVRGIATATRHRLSMGERRFGDRFLSRNNTAEAREEAADLVAYVLLELQRLERDNRLTDAVRDDLLRAAVFAAAADGCLRRVAKALRRKGGP